MSMYEGLSDDDRTAVRRSVNDLFDIDPRTRSRIEWGFARAADRARCIREGTLEALDGYDGVGTWYD